MAPAALIRRNEPLALLSTDALFAFLGPKVCQETIHYPVILQITLFKLFFFFYT